MTRVRKKINKQKCDIGYNINAIETQFSVVSMNQVKPGFCALAVLIENGGEKFFNQIYKADTGQINRLMTFSEIELSSGFVHFFRTVIENLLIHKM